MMVDFPQPLGPDMTIGRSLAGMLFTKTKIKRYYIKIQNKYLTIRQNIIHGVSVLYSKTKLSLSKLVTLPFIFERFHKLPFHSVETLSHYNYQ